MNSKSEQPGLYFEIVGLPEDIQALATFASTFGVAVHQLRGRYSLYIPDDSFGLSIEELRPIASDILANLNRMAELQWDDHNEVRISGSWSKVHPDGKVEQAITPGTARLRLRGGRPTISVGSESREDAEAQALRDTQRKIEQSSALRLALDEVMMAGPFDVWRLQRALEAVAQGLGGAEKGKKLLRIISDLGLASKEEIDEFYATANWSLEGRNWTRHVLPEHLGFERPANVRGKGMPIHDCQLFVKRVIRSFALRL